MVKAPSIAQAVGEFVAATRRKHGLTLDQVARAGRNYGARWSASSVSNIEKGQASLTPPTMFFLALALGDFVDRPLRLSDLLGEAEVVSLGGGVEFKRSWVDNALSGAEITASPDDVPGIQRDQGREINPGDATPSQPRNLTPAERRGHVRQLVDEAQLPPEPARQPRAGSLAEERAARRLDIDVFQLQQIAADLWGHSLEDESHQRAGESSTPQARGRVTRVLVEEIRHRLQAET